MSLVYLISAVFGLIIFLILVLVFSIEDRKARARIQSHLDQPERLSSRSWKRRFSPYLDAIRLPDPINQIIDEGSVIRSGIPMSHHQFMVLWWLLGMLGAVLGVIIIGLGDLIADLLAFSLILGFTAGPYLYLQYRLRDRQRVVERALPDFLDMLTFTVEAGMGLVPALQRVSKTFTGILGEELRKALFQMEMGFSRRDALQEFVNRIPSPDVEQFVEAILLSERLGTSLARTMRVQANLLRTRRRQRAEVKAQTAPIRIIPALVFFFLPSLLLIYLAPPIINFLLRR
jgi:Flp pilus assembly protein TadB